MMPHDTHNTNCKTIKCTYIDILYYIIVNMTQYAKSFILRGNCVNLIRVSIPLCSNQSYRFSKAKVHPASTPILKE